MPLRDSLSAQSSSGSWLPTKIIGRSALAGSGEPPVEWLTSHCSTPSRGNSSFPVARLQGIFPSEARE